MRDRAMSRRTMLGAGACALAAATGIPQSVSAHAEKALSPKNEETIRKYYAAWETKHWHSMDALLAEDFTFSSPLDDPMSKSAFKTGCWDTQIAFIDRFDLKQVVGTDNEALVMYVCHTTNGKTFRNVEYFQLRDGKVKAVVCYFGGKSSFPSAVSNGKV
jgi:ketosteroid isomerase-like protein